MVQRPGYIDPRRINRAARTAARRRVIAGASVCGICGRPLDHAVKWPDPWSIEVDEMIPVSRGGSPTDLRNLQAVHRRCNELKSDKSLEWARRAARGEPVVKPTRVPFVASSW